MSFFFLKWDEKNKYLSEQLRNGPGLGLGYFPFSSWWQLRSAGGLWLPWLVVLNPWAFPEVCLLPVLITTYLISRLFHACLVGSDSFS